MVLPGPYTIVLLSAFTAAAYSGWRAYSFFPALTNVTNSLDIHTMVSAINGRTNAVTALIPADGTGDEYPDVIAMNPKTNTFYWGDGQQGGLYASPGPGQSIGSFPPNGLTVDPKTNTIYSTDVDYYHNALSVISGQADTITADITLGSDPFGITVNPKTDTLYVSNAHDGTVSAINGKTDTVTATIPVGRSPLGITANPKTGTVYVTNVEDNTVSVLATRQCRNHPGTDTTRH
jgi:YVTN family beta-propeller protein